MTWAGVAQGLVALIALLAIGVLIGLSLTNLPLPQLSYGMLTDDLARLELANGLGVRRASAIQLGLPSAQPEALVKPFLQPFGASHPLGFLAIVMAVACGVAAMPHLVGRAGLAKSVLEARKSSGWILCVLVAVLLTLPALALFSRVLVLEQLPGRTLEELPAWLARASGAGLVVLDDQAARLGMEGTRFLRDGVLLWLPGAAGLPQVALDLVAVGLASAVLAAVTAQLHLLASSWAEDVVFAWSEAGRHEMSRVHAARGLAVLAAVLGVWLAVRVRADPLTLFTWSLAFAATTCFPLLVMSVWWKRIGAWGAIAGLVTGLTISLLLLGLGLAGALSPRLGSGAVLAASLGVPVAALVALLVSLLTPPPDKRARELVRDIRVPGGETVLDRDLRLARIGRNRTP